MNCRNLQWNQCEHQHFTGSWQQFKQKPQGTRHAKGIVKYPSPQKSAGGEDFIVEKIIGKRVVKVRFDFTFKLKFDSIFQQNVQYKVRWEGYSAEEDAWLDLDMLNCEDLIEEYEKSVK